MANDTSPINETQRNFDVDGELSGDDEEDAPTLLTTPAYSDDDRPNIEINSMEAFDDESLNKLYDNWLELDAQLRVFEPKHKEYVRKLDEVELLKTKYRTEFDKYKKKLDQLQKNVSQLKKSYLKKGDETKKPTANPTLKNEKNQQFATNLLRTRNSSLSVSVPSHLRDIPSDEAPKQLNDLFNTLSYAERLNLISDRLSKNELYLSRIADTLPRKDSYLKVILGGVDVSMLNKADKWTYKQEYEKFKYIVTCISLVSSLLIWLLTSSYRAFDALFHFLLVWYYCTLTIRESILVVNGSHINPWWRAHHFITTVATGILLTWPESNSYHSFRTQFFVFSFYLSFVQVLQFYYQRGCLYRLRALGETHDMEITIEGFHRWIFRGLSFLVPFLLVGYLFQLYNAYTLWQLANLPTTHEWQVLALSIIFFILFMGNIFTTYNILREKFRDKTPPVLLKEKYQSLKTLLSTNYFRRSKSFNQLAHQKVRFKSQEGINTKSKES